MLKNENFNFKIGLLTLMGKVTEKREFGRVSK